MALLRVPSGRRRGGADAERGQVLVIFAGGLSALLIAVGLVIDGGVAFFNRRDAQNTADLAALAGTRTIADHYTKGGRSGLQVWQSIEDNTVQNECDETASTPCSWTATYIRPGTTGGEVNLGTVIPGGSIPAGAQGVHVFVSREPKTYFLSVAGKAAWDVDTEATAITARSAGLPPGQVLPIAVDPPNHNFKAGMVYELTATKDAPGNFSWLSWTGSNDKDSLADSICNPDNPALSFPAWIPGDPGKTNGSDVRKCVDGWIENQRTVLIPLWSNIKGTGNNVQYEIRGLAAFTLQTREQVAIDSITARFIEYYPLPSIDGKYGGPPCAPGSDGCGDQVIFLGLMR